MPFFRREIAFINGAAPWLQVEYINHGQTFSIFTKMFFYVNRVLFSSGRKFYTNVT